MNVRLKDSQITDALWDALQADARELRHWLDKAMVLLGRNIDTRAALKERMRESLANDADAWMGNRVTWALPLVEVALDRVDWKLLATYVIEETRRSNDQDQKQG